MNSVTLTKNHDFSLGEIFLPYSKSLSNRAIIIRELCDNPFNIFNLSDSTDTLNLIDVLSTKPSKINVGPAGTNMRFLTSLLAIQPGAHELGGNPRMNERPIGDLVDCLLQMGAQITYMDKPGCPPLKIIGTLLQGGKIEIDGSTSSQFISSVLMIAPLLKTGIELSIRGKLVSEPYVMMTLELMKYFGISYVKKNNFISIPPQKYVARDYDVEGDWSAAANWYGFIACSKIDSGIIFKNLHLNSIQGDKKCVDYFKILGVETNMKHTGLEIKKTSNPSNDLVFDLRNEPDLFPPLAVACAALRLKARFEGLDTLTIKESNRIRSVATELNKLNIQSTFTNTSFDLLAYSEFPSKVNFDSYDDHRIAMAMAILVQQGIDVQINDPGVVSKSYPTYWEDLKMIRIANIY
jgi:3-phosphoshikimate 1-carboxyvinyltransferase